MRDGQPICPRCELRRLTAAAADPSWPRRAWDLGLLHKGGDPHHCPACVAQPEPPKDFICPGAEANAVVLANPQPAAGVRQDGAQPQPPVVAYRSDGGRLLNCLRHVPPPAARHADFHPVTADDLPDGGICTYPKCGTDVLIVQQGGEK
ncbi:hypothetical protein, partial [Streptomyces adelaidensis]|uniref:hypothetical protein n=1 Tax=Streptomyces adelaidensis TaxID=2796465 RepID=UPI0019078726